MYGTIMHGRLAAGSSREAFRDAVADSEYDPVTGFVSSHMLTPDGGGDDVWVAVFFTDRDAYRANADDPAQHERYVKFRAHLAEDPEWFDGEWDSYQPGS